MCYRPSLEKGSDQLIVTLYTLSTYPSVKNQLILTLFEARLVVPESLKNILDLLRQRVAQPIMIFSFEEGEGEI